MFNIPSPIVRYRLITPILVIVLIFCFAVSLARPALAVARIWESYVVLNGTYYDANANTGNPNFANQD